MIIYPAMDLMGGRAVRLRQGRFDQATTYPSEPADALRGFADAGAEWTHVVDLWHDRWTPSADHSSQFTPRHRFELLSLSASQ